MHNGDQTTFSHMKHYGCWQYFRILPFLLPITISPACKKIPPTDSFKPKVVEVEVAKMFDEYHRAIAKDGLLGEFSFLDTSANFFWVIPGYNSAIGIDSVKAILTATAPMFSEVHFHWQTLDIFPLSNTLANFTGITKGSMKDTSGVDSQVSIVESGTVIKRKDGWKLLSGQSANLVE